jgi:hypothetical protein
MAPRPCRYEKPYNIRTTVISPGAVATELPNTISEPDVAESLHKFYEDFAIPADSFARRRLCHRRAGGRGHQRNPVPADAAENLSTEFFDHKHGFSQMQKRKLGNTGLEKLEAMTGL